MVAQAREQGLALTGPDGLLKLFTKTVLETALNEEMTEHLGYEKNGAEYPQWLSVKNSDLGRGGRGGDRCSPGSGGHV